MTNLKLKFMKSIILKTPTYFIIVLLSVSLFIGGCNKDESDDTPAARTTQTFEDPRDGNEYEVVTIGDQTWFAENLRFDGAGTVLEVRTDTGWANIESDTTLQPAWCYYNNDSLNDATYGKLYNWYAVNTGSLCPTGWHIPTDAEWTELTDFLEGAEPAGGKMKSTEEWNFPNTEATNSSMFSALPGGYRFRQGAFLGAGVNANWWSATEEGARNAVPRNLYYNSAQVDTIASNKANGFSCRCVED